MTTRDPRLRAPIVPESGQRSRDPTASMSLEIDPPPPDDHDDDDGPIEHPSLAVGTSGDGDERTRIESPGGRNKTPAPPRPTRPPPIPAHGDEVDHRVGSVLGAYRIVEILGKGGMGHVYRAEHIKLGREVALKLLRGDLAKRRDAVLRFFQEAKTVNRVRHRNIVDVTDFVELDDGTTFIIMELLRGVSLGKWARTGVDLPRALAVLVQICDGLGAAHAVGVVHRDLKPDNVIVVPTSDGAELVKLLDFGVAKLVNREDHDEDIGFQTAAGSVIGTPAYMSPEQAGGMAVDHRSDIYSLGAIMYELFCGHPMFRGRSFGEYVRKHLTEMPVPPRQTENGAHIDERLEALILKSLAKDPNERFSTIIELRDGLLHLLGGIETLPPGAVVLQHSAIRSAPTAMPHSLPTYMLPLAPGAATTVPTPPVSSSAVLISPSQPGLSESYAGDSGQHAPHASEAHGEKVTPWWVWFAGGAVAVGLGIAGALWYAGAGSPSIEATQPATRPTTAPIVQPATKHVELRFDSLPSGGVHAAGHAAELCRTPCNFNVDLRDGGPTDRRTFIVRADGYEDANVEVDFAASQRDFSVTLARAAVTPERRDEPAIQGAESIEFTDDPTGKPTRRKTSIGKAKARSSGGAKAVPVEETPVQSPPPAPPEVKVDAPVVPKNRPVQKIDRTDTIDPFRKK